MRTSLPPDLPAALSARLDGDDAERTGRYPGPPTGRQPVHTCYLPVDRFTRDTATRWGEQARAALASHAPTSEAFAGIFHLAGDSAVEIRDRVVAKLLREPVEDLRIDVEDGYGEQPDDVEDRAVAAAAGELAAALAVGTAPRRVGLRIRSFDSPALRRRGMRSLDGFLSALLEATGGRLPAGFVVTLPKVSSAGQVSVFVELLSALETALGLPAGTLGFEVQVETTQVVLGPDGRSPLPAVIAAGLGRLRGLHFGTYDYTAACGIAAAHQRLDHPACDVARHVMQLAAAGTGVTVCDGSTNRVPVGSPDEVHRAWRDQHRLVIRSLAHGFYQGWDLHPAQLVARYAAVYGFFRSDAAAAADRLRAYAGSAGASGVLDEPATARALADYLLRGVDCGALDPTVATEQAGFDLTALRHLAGAPASG